MPASRRVYRHLHSVNKIRDDEFIPLKNYLRKRHPYLEAVDIYTIERILAMASWRSLPLSERMILMGIASDLLYRRE